MSHGIRGEALGDPEGVCGGEDDLVEEGGEHRSGYVSEVLTGMKDATREPEHKRRRRCRHTLYIQLCASQR